MENLTIYRNGSIELKQIEELSKKIIESNIAQFVSEIEFYPRSFDVTFENKFFTVEFHIELKDDRKTYKISWRPHHYNCI
ncbi:hypothetical protein, partial [Streptomyces sp. ID01-9D]|uniref:hypothetical protein n=1 Tax=Streptomyces sp. ID01-9D TaxID=3028659 RepID=UPI0029C208FD